MSTRRGFISAAGAAVTLVGLSGLARAKDQPAPASGPNAVPPEPVPPPRRGAGSNANYFFYSDGNPIKGLSIIVEVTEAIVAPTGFSIQLNGYSPQNADDTWQQYIYMFSPGTGPTARLVWMMENWPSWRYRKELEASVGLGAGVSPNSDLFNVHKTLLSIPGSATLPAGFKLKIDLHDDPKTSAVTGATFSVVDKAGKSTSSGLQQMQSFHFDRTRKAVTPGAMAPIVTFQLVLVGVTDGRSGFLASGAGRIVYSAKVPLTVLNEQPAGTAGEGTGTMETANTTYGELPAGPATSFTQTFATTNSPFFRPGGQFAVSRQFGADQTDVFAVSIKGQLVVFSVDADGHWTQSQGFGPIDMVVPHAFVAAARSTRPDETQVFVVDQYGQLQSFAFDKAGHVSGPIAVSAKHFARHGAPLSAALLGGDTLATFLLDAKGQLSVFTQKANGKWQGPAKLGPLNFAAQGAETVVATNEKTTQSDLFVVDAGGVLSHFGATGSTAWTGPDDLSDAGLARAGAPLAVVERNDHIDVFVVDKQGQLTQVSRDGNSASWTQPSPIGPADFAVSGAPLAATRQEGTDRLDVFVVDKQGTLNVFSTAKDGTWGDPQPIGDPGIAPNSSEDDRGCFVAASRQFGAPDRTDVFLINQTGANSPGWPVVFSAEGKAPWSGPEALAAKP